MTETAQTHVLSAEDRRKLLGLWNDTRQEYPRHRCLHELVEAQVARTPDAVAVEFEGRQMTYAELNSRANQLAHRLRKLGAGPDLLVAHCVDRSLEMVIAVLAILKAGAAYVPSTPRIRKTASPSCSPTPRRACS